MTRTLIKTSLTSALLLLIAYGRYSFISSRVVHARIESHKRPVAEVGFLVAHPAVHAEFSGINPGLDLGADDPGSALVRGTSNTSAEQINLRWNLFGRLKVEGHVGQSLLERLSDSEAPQDKAAALAVMAKLPEGFSVAGSIELTRPMSLEEFKSLRIPLHICYTAREQKELQTWFFAPGQVLDDSRRNLGSDHRTMDSGRVVHLGPIYL
ncbi:MAG: hypothetical protein LC723_06235, partial [Actinobacteria bacterium]|nr:hypothetical protein [Actinomycetota bacterium]